MSVLSGIIGEDGAILFLTLDPAKGSNEIVHHIAPIDRSVVGVLGRVLTFTGSEVDVYKRQDFISNRSSPLARISP